MSRKYLEARPIPVFPLPKVVLYPRILLPLHVFEPRYRRLLREVLDGHGRIVLAHLRPGRDAAWLSPDDVHPVMGVGQVVSYQKREGGEYEVLLLGEERVRATEWVSEEDYARASLEVLEAESPPEAERRDALCRELLGWLRAELDRGGHPEVYEKLRKILDGQRDPSFLVDFLAHHFLSSAGGKQRLLEELEVETRARRLREALGST